MSCLFSVLTGGAGGETDHRTGCLIDVCHLLPLRSDQGGHSEGGDLELDLYCSEEMCLEDNRFSNTIHQRKLEITNNIICFDWSLLTYFPGNLGSDKMTQQIKRRY